MVLHCASALDVCFGREENDAFTCGLNWGIRRWILVSLRDAVVKRRTKQYHKFSASVQIINFSCDGKFVAVVVSASFEDGVDDVPDEEAHIRGRVDVDVDVDVVSRGEKAVV
ncbi:hypothetical protein NX059_012250 [Plenodomus lindquistii]|nr:hypothetical protein NX059_012250 [Plenodomus lindquistii]